MSSYHHPIKHKKLSIPEKVNHVYHGILSFVNQLDGDSLSPNGKIELEKIKAMMRRFNNYPGLDPSQIQAQAFQVIDEQKQLQTPLRAMGKKTDLVIPKLDSFSFRLPASFSAEEYNPDEEVTLRNLTQVYGSFLQSFERFLHLQSTAENLEDLDGIQLAAAKQKNQEIGSVFNETIKEHQIVLSKYSDAAMRLKRLRPVFEFKPNEGDYRNISEISRDDLFYAVIKSDFHDQEEEIKKQSGEQKEMMRKQREDQQREKELKERREVMNAREWPNETDELAQEILHLRTLVELMLREEGPVLSELREQIESKEAELAEAERQKTENPGLINMMQFRQRYEEILNESVQNMKQAISERDALMTQYGLTPAKIEEITDPSIYNRIYDDFVRSLEANLSYPIDFSQVLDFAIPEKYQTGDLESFEEEEAANRALSIMISAGFEIMRRERGRVYYNREELLEKIEEFNGFIERIVDDFVWIMLSPDVLFGNGFTLETRRKKSTREKIKRYPTVADNLKLIQQAGIKYRQKQFQRKRTVGIKSRGLRLIYENKDNTFKFKGYSKNVVAEILRLLRKNLRLKHMRDSLTKTYTGLEEVLEQMRLLVQIMSTSPLLLTQAEIATPDGFEGKGDGKFRDKVPIFRATNFQDDEDVWNAICVDYKQDLSTLGSLISARQAALHIMAITIEGQRDELLADERLTEMTTTKEENNLDPDRLIREQLAEAIGPFKDLLLALGDRLGDGTRRDGEEISRYLERFSENYPLKSASWDPPIKARLKRRSDRNLAEHKEELEQIAQELPGLEARIASRRSALAEFTLISKRDLNAGDYYGIFMMELMENLFSINQEIQDFYPNIFGKMKRLESVLRQADGVPILKVFMTHPVTPLLGGAIEIETPAEYTRIIDTKLNELDEVRKLISQTGIHMGELKSLMRRTYYQIDRYNRTNQDTLCYLITRIASENWYFALSETEQKKIINRLKITNWKNHLNLTQKVQEIFEKDQDKVLPLLYRWPITLFNEITKKMIKQATSLGKTHLLFPHPIPDGLSDEEMIKEQLRWDNEAKLLVWMLFIIKKMQELSSFIFQNS